MGKSLGPAFHLKLAVCSKQKKYSVKEEWGGGFGSIQRIALRSGRRSSPKSDVELAGVAAKSPFELTVRLCMRPVSGKRFTIAICDDNSG